MSALDNTHTTHPSQDAQPELAPNDGAANALPPATPWLPELRPLHWRDPVRWLQAGWSDFLAQPGIGLFYGACFVLMGWALAAMATYQPAYVLALAGGFMLMSPFLCLGLYEASRLREVGQPTTLWRSLTTWRRNLSALAIFCGVLLVLEMLWSRSALVIFAVSFNTIPETTHWAAMLLDPENLGFVITYLGVGALFASLIFATSVVSMPMLIDHDDDTKADAITAGLTSIRVCLDQPALMLWWAVLIATTVGLAMLPAFLGLLVVAPVIGHASWHAYRGIVVRGGLQKTADLAQAPR
ncbi:MAG: DUF2189 domain-containing protein [Rhizobacter sp.]